MRKTIGSIGAALLAAALAVACASSNTAAKPDNAAPNGGSKYGTNMDKQKMDNGNPCNGGM
jgi:hypothetical protein